MAVPTRLRAANFNNDFMGGIPALAEGSKGLYAISASVDAIHDEGGSNGGLSQIRKLLNDLSGMLASVSSYVLAR